MTSDETPLVGEQIGSSSVALLPANAMEQHNGEWTSANALMQPAAPAQPDFMVYFHAFRRHWLLSAGIGLLCAAIVGPAVWFSVGDKYTASSYLRVAMSEKPILEQTSREGSDRDRFEIYKNTQQGLVLSRFVLLSALRNKDVAKLASVKEATENGDAITWLMKQLSVSFPLRAEIMEIDATRPNKDEATALSRAVVEAYLKEVVYAEQDLKRGRLGELDKAFGENETAVRAKREELKKLADQLGASEKETLTLKQKMALEELSSLRSQLMQAQFEVRKFKGELAAQQSLLKAMDAADTNDLDMEMAIQNDPIARQLSVELSFRKMDQFYMENAVVSSMKSRYANRGQQDLEMLQKQYDTRRGELSEMVKQKKKSMVMADAEKAQGYLAVMTEQEQALRQDVQAKQIEAEKFGSSSVDVDMMQADIKNLDKLLMDVANERDKLRVEIRATPRITLLQRADVPEVPANTFVRMAMTIMAMLVASCCPAIVIMLLDFRAKHINDCSDVSKGLRLSVIGSVPLIPARVIRRLGSPAKKYQTWQVRLTESVDGIAARVLRKAETEQCRVIMVSSAMGGEGKTTLATQLAMSLARAGRRTVLVDFDLRRPAFDEIFGLPLEPGVCEALRDQNAVSATVHQVGADNLAVVTAGRWDRTALASLSNGSAAAMFKELRAEYDFVVVDTSPILPVADARFVSQHVDSVVLSVFRDISEAPKIQAACEILAAFGVQTVEAVVTGPNDNMYGQHMGYESTIPA
jgi:polysaccharide biosynthesis transport protein